MALFTVKIEVDGQVRNIDYDSIVACIKDESLKMLIEGHGEAGIPVMKWSRFVDSLVSNSVKILQELK